MKYFLYFSLGFVYLLALELGNQNVKRSARAEIDPNAVTYIYYSRNYFDGVVIDYESDPNLVRIQKVFNPHLPTIVLIHGWQDNYEANSNTFVREAVLSKINANIIKVDWGPLSNLGYFAARDAVPYVGRIAANLIREISFKFNYPLSNITLVGFSLGAHISGNIGKALHGRIGVIVALDPAGPFIDSSDVSYSVHPTDAQYVQSIHTNGGTLGMTDAVGHSDFYPNGGSRQPGCGLDLIGGCAHNRAWEYFAESVGSNNFLAVTCDNYDSFQSGRCSGEKRKMGGLNTIDKTARGKFYLETNSAAPYGRG